MPTRGGKHRPSKRARGDWWFFARFWKGKGKGAVDPGHQRDE